MFFPLMLLHSRRYFQKLKVYPFLVKLRENLSSYFPLKAEGWVDFKNKDKIKMKISENGNITI